MEKISSNKIILGAASLILVAFFVFLFFREGKRTQLSISTEDNASNQSGEIETIKKEEDDNQKEEVIPDGNISDNSASKDVAESNSKSDLKKTEDNDINITKDLVGWGYQKSGNRSIDTLIIHSSYDATSSNPYSYSGILGEYKAAGVSPHYIIDRKGKIYRLVEDQNIAYHAGVSKMPDGRTGVNSFSIGVEIMNTKTDKFTDAQYASLKNLIAYLKEKYGIKNVLGHKDIAPERKDDPWNFDWNRIK